MRRTATSLIAALACLLSCSLAGAQGLTGTASVNLLPCDAELTSPSGQWRWRDVADYLYAQSFRDAYRYASASVSVKIQTNVPVLSGTLTATGLKPNFAYQIKIVGDPGHPSNEKIGLAGRWWREEWQNGAWTGGRNLNDKGDGASPNPNDKTYFKERDEPLAASPTGKRYRFTGYLLFAFFITDQNGYASFDFKADSSYHVLWKTSQRGQGDKDGPVESATIEPRPKDPAYRRFEPPVTVSVYGEWERLPIGGVRLAPGEYACRLLLTEESFHDSGGEFAGNWAAALVADVTFAIVAE